MPPYLHPRSRSTTSLFTSCLAVSFLVVSLPHILPCPVDRRQSSDSGEPIRRRRRKAVTESAGDASGSRAETMNKMAEEVEIEERRKARECPVPKPGGSSGQVMGFQNEKAEPMKVVVQPVRNRGKVWESEANEGD